MNDRSLNIMARLQTLLAIQKARVTSNPEPYIEEAHRLASETYAMLRELDAVMNGLDDPKRYTMDDAAPPAICEPLETIVVPAHVRDRFEKARGLLHEFMNK